jgi:hypothetical protein
MILPAWLKVPNEQKKSKAKKARPSDVRPAGHRAGQTVLFNLSQDGNRIDLKGDGLELFFEVEGANLPPNADPSFAVWALLPCAMEEGFDLHINSPIDPRVAANAEYLSRIWAMWVPGRYRSIKVGGAGDWKRAKRDRLPLIHLYSGGIDSTYALFKQQDTSQHRYALTVCGVDQIDDDNMPLLVGKTEPSLKKLGYKRLIVRTNAHREPFAYTNGMTLASCAFLLSDLFDAGCIAADLTPWEEMAVFPWGANSVANEYFAGSDFAVKTVGGSATRTEKIFERLEAGVDPNWWSFCRNRKVLPGNCGVCRKCVKTKAMLLLATGNFPDIFVDKRFDEALVMDTLQNYSDRIQVFDVYFKAVERGMVEQVPGLAALIDHYRRHQPTRGG